MISLALKHRKTVIAILLVLIVAVAFFVAYSLNLPAKPPPAAPKPFYFGVELGYNTTLAGAESLIDTVKGYTNLLLIASPTIIKNETLLNETCDYAYNAGLYFMPVYYQNIDNSTFIGYLPNVWFTEAKQRYGSHLLGVYYYDEPGGSQLDTSQIIPNPVLTSPPTSYLDYATYFNWLWNHSGGGIQLTANFVHSLNSTLLTSDYALYWFDYELGYDTILAQFGWNNSRPMQISLARGAATAQNKNWGAIVTWTYNQTPYYEPPAEMYSDMVLAYNCGASYVAVYDSSADYAGSILTPQYYQELQAFWNYTQQNPTKHGSLKADTAVVLPQDYAFGFRSLTDSVWQQHTATAWTQTMYLNITSLLNQYNSSLDIVYSDPQFHNAITSHYSKVLYWPQDFEKGVTYPVVDVNNDLGYDTIQDALSSFATYPGATVQVKPGNYQENIQINKAVTLTSQNYVDTAIRASGDSTAVTIIANNTTLKGFTIASSSLGSGTGVYLENAQNCLVSGNNIVGFQTGVLLSNSSYNKFRNNLLNNDTYSVIFQNSPSNSVDSSNKVDGKPYTSG